MFFCNCVDLDYLLSEQKSVKGTIKGTGYVCGCNDCNYTKVSNSVHFIKNI